MITIIINNWLPLYIYIYNILMFSRYLTGAWEKVHLQVRLRLENVARIFSRRAQSVGKRMRQEIRRKLSSGSRIFADPNYVVTRAFFLWILSDLASVPCPPLFVSTWKSVTIFRGVIVWALTALIPQEGENRSSRPFACPRMSRSRKVPLSSASACSFEREEPIQTSNSLLTFLLSLIFVHRTELVLIYFKTFITNKLAILVWNWCAQATSQGATTFWRDRNTIICFVAPKKQYSSDEPKTRIPR